MPASSAVGRHLVLTGFRFIFDGLLVPLSVIAGASWRFGTLFPSKLEAYAPAMMCAALVLPSLSYIGGLYSPTLTHCDSWARVRWFFFSLAATVMVLMGMGSVSLEARVGRGVLVYGLIVLTFCYAAHHFLLSKRLRMRRLRTACLVSGPDDEMAAEILARSSPQIEVVGLIAIGDSCPLSGHLPFLGKIDGLESMELPIMVNTILVRDRHLVMPQLTTVLRRWRYQGIEIMSLADACEMMLQAVPLPLVTESWLFRASSQSGLLYIKKLKRLFDITTALLCLITLWPVLLAGIFLVRLTSPGPVFFRQIRLGRLGRQFSILKLRTMRLDAEKDGPQWSSGKDDRVFPAGVILRRYRIDEIPQLFNILRGDMSFVGPRPERPEFIDQLEQQVPFYRERLLVQPGLTGWAQVRYPYGSNLEDAWRKHELDLYYIKHMSILLDFFVLLETTRTVLIGGNSKSDAHTKAMHQWNKLVPGSDKSDNLSFQPLVPALPKL
jgi:exopolysaccharide biosynthesis polyprenyl glycosylphosphotransferase